jgi:hypothetical protein
MKKMRSRRMRKIIKKTSTNRTTFTFTVVASTTFAAETR